VIAPASAQGITDTVISGPFLLAAGLAIAAGVVSFASPCVVPLVPGYLSYLAGLVGADTRDSAATPALDSGSVDATAASVAPPSTQGGVNVSTEVSAPAQSVGDVPDTGRNVRWRAVIATLLFVAGFSVVFLLETALVLGLAHTVMANQALLTRIGGAITIFMGLVLAGVVPLMQRDIRPRVRPRGRVWGAPLLGAAFGTGWLACTSPTLAGVVALSVSSEWNGYAWRGLLLVLLYCAGLGIPFLLLSVGFSWATTMLGFMRRHARAIQLIGAGALIVIGVLMITGVWASVIGRLQGAVVVL
jgi:cytochrome c-type biogenesis protein